MAIHSLYPGFIKMFYTGNGHQHVQVLPVVPSEVVSGTWYVRGNDGTFYTFTDAMDVYTDVFADLLAGSDGIGYAELYTMTSETADPLFVASLSLAVSGHAATASVPNSQAVIPFRTSVGGLFRFYAMEGFKETNIVDRLPISDTEALGIIGFLTGDQGFVVGRDGGSLVAATSFITKVNDRLRKKNSLSA